MLFSHSLIYLLPFVSFTSASPTRNARTTLSRRNTTEPGIYYGVTSAEHEEHSKTLKKGGYRIQSLSVFGAPPEVRYAAIWTKTEGAAFETIADANEDAFNAWHESWKSKGYVSTHVSATGPDGRAVFAGAMEQANITEVHACGMNTPYAFQNVTMGMDIAVKGFSIYGEPSDRRYCIIGHENTGHRKQITYYPPDAQVYDFQTKYKAVTSARFWRPAFFDISNDLVVSALYEDTSIGKWEAKFNVTASGLDAEIQAQKSKGLSLIQLQGGDDGKNTIYTAIFAEEFKFLPMEWNANGEIAAFTDNEAATTDLDATMRNWMAKNGIRQAQVAISRNGTLRGERAFTLAERDFPVVHPTDKMLLGSVSKMFTHAAVQCLIDDKLINLTTKVFPLLGYNNPKDARTSDITVDHLIQHTAGYNRDRSGDIAYKFREVAIFNNRSEPSTLRDMIEYQVNQLLDFTPGESYSYSNFGTMMLSYIVANLTGAPYLDFLKERVLKDDFEVEPFTSPLEDHINDPIVQESRFVNLSPFFPQESVLIPNVAGGDGTIKEETFGVAALRASAATVSRFVGNHGKRFFLQLSREKLMTNMLQLSGPSVAAKLTRAVTAVYLEPVPMSCLREETDNTIRPLFSTRGITLMRTSGMI